MPATTTNKSNLITSVNAFALSTKSDRSAVTKWSKRNDFPDLKKGVDLAAAMEYAKLRKEEAAKLQTGKDSDLKRLKLEKQIALLDYEIKTAARNDELNRIEYEAKRGLWYSVDDLKQFAAMVAGSFDEGINAVELATRDAKAVSSVRESFDRIRANLAKQLIG
jgi:CRISPR/Cas system-associated endonuclease Cas1